MKQLPIFASEEEFAKFVETHDLADYWDELEDVDIEIHIPRPERKIVPVQLSEPVLESLEKAAAHEGVPVHVIIRWWLTERARALETADAS